MSNLHFAASSAPLKSIQEIQFGLMAPDEIQNMSVAHIIYPETMDEQKQRPREGGLNDPKLGSIDRGMHCASCGENMQECPGHFGHIELVTPVFHVGFINKIKKLLECVCHNCGKILADESDQHFKDALRLRDPKKRFEAIWKVCKPKLACAVDSPSEDGDPKKAPKVQHGGCGNRQPEIRKDGLKLMGTWKPQKNEEEEEGRQPEKRPIKPQDAMNIFKLISDEALSVLGLNVEFARPEWMILSVLPVPPPPVRPSISVDGTGQGMRGEDDLTYKLADIVRSNGQIKSSIENGAAQHVLNDYEDLLQWHVATYLDNDIAGQPKAQQKSGRPLKTLRGRLKGKDGRLRGNLMGKRVDFSARTVITGDPNLSLDEVGVPRSIARTLSYPETVTPYNIAKLHQLVKNGPDEHPGAKYIIRDDGSRIDLRHHKRAGEIQLAYGWKVERHIVDGDFIIFNRQPSLHKESMMGHRVRVMPYSTFRLNLSVTSPYNADFDGDEMNLHVPQSEETRAEIMNLCMVPLNIVSPQRNGPLMGIVQDTLCGIYKICNRDIFLTKDQVMNILMWVPDWDGVIPQPAIVKPRPRWTGKQIISLALPEINLVKPAKSHAPIDDNGVVVIGGELMYGLFNKKIVGASSGGIIHTIYNEKGWETAVNFFNAAQRIVNYWLLQTGFSIGIGDTIPDAVTTDHIQDAINKQKEEVEAVTALATQDKLDPLPGMTKRETFESKVSVFLNKARDDAGAVTAQSVNTCNNAIAMANSGSKGSTINISQMTALVGQQSVEGKRIPFGFKYRTLPHFTKDDYSPAARGFVQNSYLRGLTPTEFFFHAMAGREGLIDTAVKTAETGYIQRRLVKALEDVMTKYDGTVRNSLGDIVQFVYGEDGLDGIAIEKQACDFVACSDGQFERRFFINVMDPSTSLSSDVLEQADAIAGDVEVQRMLDEEYAQLEADRKFVRTVTNEADDQRQLPLNISRIIETAKSKFRIKDGSRSDLHPSEVIPKVREVLDRLIIVRGEDDLSQEAQDNATLLFKAQLRSKLAFKRVVREYSLNKLAFENVLGDLENRFNRAIVSPGEMVGVLAAQSIGEPATQMTLNTFHFAGVSSKNVTLGVPRLKEILNVAKNIKTPSMKVFTQSPLDLDDDSKQKEAKLLRSRIEHTTLRSVTECVEIYYDPDIQSTVIEADQDMVESYFIIPDDSADDIDSQSKWLMRVVLNRGRLLDKGLTVPEVASRIKEEYHRNLAVIFSDNNAEELVIRVRLIKHDNKDDESEEQDEALLKMLETRLLDDLSLRGVPGIERAFINHGQRQTVKEDGALAWEKNNDCMEWFLETTGTALSRVLPVDGVDSSRTYSNNFFEIIQVFGIEATRAALLKELTQVLAFDGSYVNHRHLALLVDVMTSRGMIMAVTRHGINRADTGALMRCSFEETVEILLEAAACGELDDCRGVSENIMLGQLAPAGTGEMDVFVDRNMLNTCTSDNSRFGLMPGMAAAASYVDAGAATPYDLGSPSHEANYAGPDYGASFSPMVQAGQDDSGGFTQYGPSLEGGFSPYAGGRSPGYVPTSPFSGTSPTSPGYSPTSPGYSPTSPGMALTSPRFGPTSPGFSPTSPAYSPTSPGYSPTSPAYGASPTSPSYSPTSPSYSPTSPTSPTSPAYSPTSPSYSPTSPAHATSPKYSPTSPAYSPTSPMYSPTSPQFGSGSDRRSPTSPMSYSPTSPVYSPTSPAQDQYSPTSPRFSPTSPANAPYSATSPKYSPTSPKYSPTSPRQD